jgi:hypothetical protein
MGFLKGQDQIRSMTMPDTTSTKAGLPEALMECSDTVPPAAGRTRSKIAGNRHSGALRPRRETPPAAPSPAMNSRKAPSERWESRRRDSLFNPATTDILHLAQTATFTGCAL